MLSEENAKTAAKALNDAVYLDRVVPNPYDLEVIMNAVRQEERERPGEIPTSADLETIGAVGRKPTISKHRAANLAHIRDTVAALDAAGLTEAADTIVWSVWFRVLDHQREEFLLADANKRLAEERARVRGVLEEAQTTITESMNWMIDLANSGDAGFWDTEKTPQVIACRATLARIRQAKESGQ